MKKAHTLTAMAVLALTLTGCGGTETKTDTATEQTSSPAPSVEATGAETPLNIKETILDKTDGKDAATITITSAKDVQCDDKTMRSITFTISAPKDAFFAPNYNIAGWTAYSGSTALENAGSTSAAMYCTPEKFHSALVNPGETVEGIEVVLDVEGADAVGIQLAGSVQELIIGL